MKSNEKVVRILTGVVILTLGILIAIFGGQAVLDIYFGVVALIGAASFLVLSMYQLGKEKRLNPIFLVLGTILTAVGIGLLVHYLSVGILINFLVLVILGAGSGLILYGVYCIAKKETVKGVLDIVIGAAALTLAILYMTVPEFQQAFWIVVGVLFAVYGLVMIIQVIVEIAKKK